MNKLKASLLSMSLMLLAHVAMAATQVLTLNEGERLTASISMDAMNRLAVANDRIVNLFGDEGTFVSQQDEQTGQLFIKPTVLNAQKPLSLTLVTENGLTQDLNLIPDASEPSTILLKSHTLSPPALGAFGHTFKASNTVDRAVQILKQAMVGELPPQEESVKPRVLKAMQCQYQNTFVQEGFKVEHWVLHNTTQALQGLREKDLYQAGDIAITVDKEWFDPGEKGDVYILRLEVSDA